MNRHLLRADILFNIFIGGILTPLAIIFGETLRRSLFLLGILLICVNLLSFRSLRYIQRNSPDKVPPYGTIAIAVALVVGVLSSSYIFSLLRPQAPSDVSAKAVDSVTIELRWVGGSSVTEGFHIFDENNKLVGAKNANDDSLTKSGLKPNSYHCYRIHAYNQLFYSTASEWACTRTRP